MKNNSQWLVFLFAVLLFVSCTDNKNTIFDQHLETSTSGWEKKDLKTYVFEVNDTISRHNLFMNLRVDKNYEYSNMFVIMKIYQPNEVIVVDTLQYQIADSNGELLGNGFSDVKENQLWLKEGYTFPIKGNYKFTIEQAVRKLGAIEGDSHLKGVLEVGLQIEKSE